MKSIIAILMGVVLFIPFACRQGNGKITNPKDYAKFIDENTHRNKNLGKIDADISFWNSRFSKTPDDLTSRLKIAGLLSRRFQYSGDIREVQKADSIYFIANNLLRQSSSSVFRSLAANCVTQHQFRQAEIYLDSASHLGDNRLSTEMQKFDVSLELGKMIDAKLILGSFKDQNDFEYLTRAAKYEDHRGHLDKAIQFMEKAFSEIKDLGNNTIYCWTRTNLGDMYGHANRIEESYSCYIDALKHDPEYFHALKGIAWIAFSYDRDSEAAKKIIKYLIAKHPVPDYLLILAQISEFDKDYSSRDQFIQEFMQEVQKPSYGDMYNKYLFYLLADHLTEPGQALRIAEKEIQNRPTPESYNFLSWAYYKSGDYAKSKQIAESFVENKCFEPDALYHLGVIYKKCGDISRAKYFLSAALNSSFELGPYYQPDIQKELKEL